jgi:PKD repeat protein
MLYGSTMLSVYDVRNPLNAGKIAQMPIGDQSGLDSEADWLHVLSYSTYFLMDVSDPWHPVRRDYSSMPGEPSGIHVRGFRTLVASDEYGLRIFSTKTCIAPLADFDWSPKPAAAGQAIRFFDLSKSHPTQWDWDFGDGSTSNDQDPEHVFADAGAFAVTLEAANPWGADTRQRTVQVETQPSCPQSLSDADIWGPASALEADADTAILIGTDLTLVDVSDGYHPREISRAFLDWEYRSIRAFGPYVSATDGSNLVLFERMEGGSVRSISETINLEGVAYLAVEAGYAFIATQGDALLIYSLADPTAPRDVGRVSAAGVLQGVWTQRSVLLASVKDIGLEVYDITIPPSPILMTTLPDILDVRAAAFSGALAYILEDREMKILDLSNPSSPIVLSAVSLDFNPNDLRLSGTALAISFWNGAQLYSLKDPLHPLLMGAYQGEDSVGGIAFSSSRLLWSRSGGLAVLDLGICGLQADPLPHVDFFSNPPYPVSGVPAAFLDASIGAPSAWEWDFGDGGTSSERNPIHVYATPGRYSLTLTVWNAWGERSHQRIVDVVDSGQVPQAAFDTWPHDLCAGTSIQFVDRTLNAPARWQWDFGDGSRSEDPNPRHDYPPGTYRVTLTASNLYGFNRSMKDLKVHAPGSAAAAFVWTPLSPVPLEAADFTDLSWEAERSSWDFGDGTTAEGGAPSHAYENAGVYTVTLHAQTSEETRTLSKTLQVQDPAQCMRWLEPYSRECKPVKMLVEDSILFLLTEEPFTDFPKLGRLTILDISDAEAYRELGFYDFSNCPTGIVRWEHYAGVTDGGGNFTILDVADPAHIRQAGLWHSAGYLDVAMLGPYALLASYKLDILDVRDPACPVLAASWPFAGYIDELYLSGSRLYLVGGNDLEVLDLRDPLSPVDIGGWYEWPWFPIDVEVSWPYVYVMSWDVLDVFGGFQPDRMDLSGCSMRSISLAGSLAFASDEGCHMWILDLANPENPAIWARLSHVFARQVARYGTSFLIADYNQGLRTLDMSSCAVLAPEVTRLAPIGETGSVPLPGWMTDVDLCNPQAGPARAALDFTSGGTSASAPRRTALALPGESLRSLPDFLGSVLSMPGEAGLLRLSGPASLSVSAWTHVDRGDQGTVGWAQDRFGDAAVLTSGQEGRLPFLMHGGGYRTSLGISNLTAQTLEGIWQGFRMDGSPWGEAQVSLPPWGYSEIPFPWAVEGVEGRDGFAVLRLQGDDARALAWAKMLDEASGDVRFLPIQTPPTSSGPWSAWVPGAAKASGAYSSQWQTSLALHNPASAASRVWLSYQISGAPSPPVQQREISIGSGTTAYFENLVGGVFGLQDSFGILKIESDTPLMASACTTNIQSGTGRLIQELPIMREEQTIASGDQAIIAGLLENKDFRTNLGLANLSSGEAKVRIEIFESQGGLLGAREYVLGPWQVLQDNSIIMKILQRPAVQIFATVTNESAAPASIIAYASVIDNRSGDGRLLRARRWSATP